MFVVHMDLMTKPGLGAALATTYRDAFVPAVTRQPGFAATLLLVARSSDMWTHRLVVTFEDEALQQRWVTTESHRIVWAKMEPTIANYSVDVFDTAL